MPSPAMRLKEWDPCIDGGCKIIHVRQKVCACVANRHRSSDLTIFSRTLSQLSYRNDTMLPVIFRCIMNASYAQAYIFCRATHRVVDKGLRSNGKHAITPYQPLLSRIGPGTHQHASHLQQQQGAAVPSLLHQALHATEQMSKRAAEHSIKHSCSSEGAKGEPAAVPGQCLGAAVGPLGSQRAILWWVCFHSNRL